MCSFLFSTKQISKDRITDINRYNQFRGPDITETKVINGHTFIHNLLSITGTFTPQPLVEDDIVILFNGEIYNYKELGNYDNDTKCIIPLYKQYGPAFTKKLDGEFAITLVDYKKRIVIITSDIFKTKPIQYAINGANIGTSSYKIPLEQCGFTNVQKAKPNETLVVNLDTGAIIERFEI